MSRLLLAELLRYGVRVVVEGDALRITGPRRPPDALLERVREHKPELLALLNDPSPATMAAPELRRRYAAHLAAVAGTLDTLEAEKRAAWIETALDWLEADPERALLPNRSARRLAAAALAEAGIPRPGAQPLLRGRRG